MSLRYLIAGVATVLVTAGSALAQPTPVVIPLGDYLGLRTVQTTVAGQQSAFILDTGGGISVVSPGLAGTFGCTSWGQITGFRMTGERLTMPRCDNLQLQLDGATVTSPSAGVFDLSSLLPPDAPRIEGLMALDALQGRPFTLELAAGRLTLETPDSLAARIEGAVEAPVRFHRQAGGASLTVMVRVMTPQGPLWMQLESGSAAAMVVATTSAAPLGLDPAVQRQPFKLRLDGATGGALEADTTALVRDMIIDGNIGLPIMRQWVMTFDLDAGRLWIKPAA